MERFFEEGNVRFTASTKRGGIETMNLLRDRHESGQLDVLGDEDPIVFSG